MCVVMLGGMLHTYTREGRMSEFAADQRNYYYTTQYQECMHYHS